MGLVKRERGTMWPVDPGWTDERIDRVFRDMFREFFTGGALMERFFDGGRTSMIRLEEFVEDGTCVIRAEMPGIDPDKDVEITVADGILHLAAHREERKEEERPSGLRSEFHYGSFERHIRLPEAATEQDIKATYKDGILEIRVPISEKVEPAHKIPIDHA